MPMRALPVGMLDQLRSIVGDDHVRTGDRISELDPGQHPGNLGASALVTPTSTSEVAAIVRLCATHHVPIVPHGGRTGLVGGGISHPGEIVVSLRRMKRVESLVPADRVAIVEAGCTLEALQLEAAEHRLEPGIDLAARGSATIGGMVSTNAGGVMAFRNGVMRHRVLGLEAVLADGRVYSDLTQVVKNSAGYDLKHLFIGAEGTLGIVTRVAIKLDPLPPATATAMLGLPSVAAALDAIRIALDAEAGHLRAAEAMWQGYLRLTAGYLGWSGAGIGLDHPIYLLLLLGGTSDDALHHSLAHVFETTAAAHPGTTGIVAGSMRQAAELWRLREDTDLLYLAHPGSPSYDVSVPSSQIEGYAASVFTGLTAIDPTLAPYVFGHIADGNLHVSINRTAPLEPELAARIDDVLYRDVRRLGGSFSAEHGVGSKRIGPMFDTTDPTKLGLMRLMKTTLDPLDLMNPGKVLPLL
ncbi:MAG: FAD-binding oxidoreductase [Ilumatobacteraceae bacterium]